MALADKSPTWSNSFSPIFIFCGFPSISNFFSGGISAGYRMSPYHTDNRLHGYIQSPYVPHNVLLDPDAPSKHL